VPIRIVMEIKIYSWLQQKIKTLYTLPCSTTEKTKMSCSVFGVTNNVRKLLLTQKLDKNVNPKKAFYQKM
jgi:hypothetical protein